MATPDDLADVDDTPASAQLLKRFEHPLLEVILGGHSPSLPATGLGATAQGKSDRSQDAEPSGGLRWTAAFLYYLENETMFALSLAVVAVALGALLTALSARQRRSQERALTRALPHHGTNVPQVAWTLSSYDAVDPVMQVLRSSSARTPNELMVELQQHLQELSPEQRERAESAMSGHARATAEREIWHDHRQAVRGAAAVGAVDGLILGLGENSEWVTEIVGSAASSAPEAFSGLLVGKFTRHALPDDWSEALVGNVADGIDVLVDPAVDAGIETLGGALGAIADAHLPVVATTRAVLRAFKQHEAGLEGERVAENLMLDGGLTGGSAVAGAALGTAVFPVVGPSSKGCWEPSSADP